MSKRAAILPSLRGRHTSAMALVVLGLATASAGLALGLGRTSLAGAIEWTLYDVRIRHTIEQDAAPHELVMVEIDEQTLREMEPLVGR